MLGVSMANNIEEEHWERVPCMHGPYSKRYFDEELGEGMNCELNPYQPCPDIRNSETRCCEVSPMPWQRTEGHKWHDGLPRCHYCPAWTIKNSIVSTDYLKTRCFVDCSDAFASMRVDATTTQDFINDLKSKGFKAHDAEYYWSRWSSKAATVQMQQVQTRGNPEIHHFVPSVEVSGEGPVCTPCAEGKTKFTSRNSYHRLFGPSGEWLGMDASVGVEGDPYGLEAAAQALITSQRAQNADFPFKTTCEPCPRGTVQYFKFVDNFGSADVTEFDAHALGFQHRDFRCAVCPTLYGVSPWSAGNAGAAYTGSVGSACKPCSNSNNARGRVQFQSVARSETSLPITTYNSEAMRDLWLPKECAECPLGFDRHLDIENLAYPYECRELVVWSDGRTAPQKLWSQSTADLTPIASSVYDSRTKNGCCSSCGMNKKRGENDVECVDVESYEATEAVFGNTRAIRCEAGMDILYCPINLPTLECVTVDPAGVRDYWRSCRACPLTSRLVSTYQAGTLLHTCSQCVTVPTLSTAEGELRDIRDASAGGDPSKCVQCPSCEYLHAEFRQTDVALAATPGVLTTDEYYEEQDGNGNLHKPKKRLLDPSQPSGHYVTEVITTCRPIPMRELEFVEGNVRIKAGTRDQYKRRKTQEDVNIFADVYGLFRLVDVPVGKTVKEGNCEMLTDCMEVCDAPFMYSDRCGPQNANPLNVYVQNVAGGLLMTLEKAVANEYIAASNVEAWQIKYDGVCKPCTECRDGEYTKGCNEAGAVVPGGSCESCTPSPACAADHYMWHELGVEGCTARFERGVRQGRRPQTPYVCRRCPKWVMTTETTARVSELRVVAGCGSAENREYAYWTVDQATGNHELEDEDMQESLYEVGNTRPFCPRGHFYDEESDVQCGLNRDTSEFAQTGLGGEGFSAQGFDELNDYQLHNCCKPCKECQGDLARRGPDYRECDGTALRDTQSKHCVDKCPFGTHQDNSTCVRCQECFVGESDTRV